MQKMKYFPAINLERAYEKGENEPIMELMRLQSKEFTEEVCGRRSYHSLSDKITLLPLLRFGPRKISSVDGNGNRSIQYAVETMVTHFVIRGYLADEENVDYAFKNGIKYLKDNNRGIKIRDGDKFTLLIGWLQGSGGLEARTMLVNKTGCSIELMLVNDTALDFKTCRSIRGEFSNGHISDRFSGQYLVERGTGNSKRRMMIAFNGDNVSVTKKGSIITYSPVGEISYKYNGAV
jgi:hypothetical protein